MQAYPSCNCKNTEQQRVPDLLDFIGYCIENKKEIILSLFVKGRSQLDTSKANVVPINKKFDD